MANDRSAEIGTLWENKSTKGSTYYKGKISGVEVVAFPGTTASGKKHITVVKSQPREAPVSNPPEDF